MKLNGFIGPAYTLKSVNIDAQRCVNLYPELIESGLGKDGQVAYLKSTPGLQELLTVGDGPIRLIHVDSSDRVLVVSGNKLYRVAHQNDWTMDVYNNQTESIETLAQATDINTGTDVFTIVGHPYETGQRVRVESSGTLPTGLSAATDYWVIKDSSSTFRLAVAFSTSILGSPDVDITAVGSGTLSFYPQSGSTLTNISVIDDINYSTNTITKAAHGLTEGDGIRVDNIAMPLPGGLSESTTYYVIVVDANSFQLAATTSDVINDTEIDLTTPSGPWAATLLGTLDTSTGPVKASSSSIGATYGSTVIVDGTNMYLFWGTFGPIIDFGYNPVVGATDVVYIDGYYVVNKSGTDTFYVSTLNGFNFDTLSFASSEGSPDKIEALMANHRDLWIFNEQSIEVWVNTGNQDFPFERIQGGYIEKGCLAKYSVDKIEGTNFWLGRNAYGQGIVYAAKGLQPQRISTHAIEYAISTYAAPENATAYTYQMGGHSFYVLNFDEATWVYDLSTRLWHERAYTNAGVLERHLGGTHAFYSPFNYHFIGDYATNELYILNEDYYSDDGDAITRLRSTPHISSGMNRIFCKKLTIDMETGVGLVSGQGSDPQVMLDWSDDGGHTWSDESWTSAGGQVGGIGEYSTRVIWRRLGSFRDRIFRVKITDPVKVTFLDAHVDLEMGAN